MDSEPTATSDDFSDIINAKPLVSTMTDMTKGNVQPVLKVAPGETNQAILQRISELEQIVKDGFDKISSKLSNTVVSAAAQKGGKRRTVRRRRSKMRSKQSSNVY